MLIRRNMLKVALLTMLVAVTTASNALAADSGCLRKGERIFATGNGMVYVAKPMMSDAGWDRGAENIYACSTKYKKRVLIGGVGTHGGQSYKLDFLRGEERFAAFVMSGSDWSAVRLVSLASGDLVGDHVSLGSLPSSDPGVTALTLATNGHVGWIAVGKSAGGSPLHEVREARPRAKSQLVSSDLNIDPYLLRFSENDRITWSPSADSVAVQSRKPSAAPARKAGSCVRKGESVHYAASGVVVTKRPFRGDRRSDGYKLTACSTRYHRRIALGKFGVWDAISEQHIIAAAGIQANVRYIAFAREDHDLDFVSSFNLTAFDLATGKLILSRPDGSSRFHLDANGNIAWIAYSGPPKGGGSFSLELFDARGFTTVIGPGPGWGRIDPWFVAFEEGAGGVRLHYANATEYSPPFLRSAL